MIILRSEGRRPLGAVPYSSHVAALCRSGFYHLRRLRPVLRHTNEQPEHSSRHLYQVAWTIVIHCSMACLRALSVKFSPSRMPQLDFSLELDEGNASFASVALAPCPETCRLQTGMLCLLVVVQQDTSVLDRRHTVGLRRS